MSASHCRRIAYSQNFLRNPQLVDRLLDRAGIVAGDLVIEIGPGRGVITEGLAARCRQVLAVEKDPLLVEELRLRFASAGNVALFAFDFLHFPLPLTTYKVFANIPFNITAAIVGKLTSGSSPPVDAHLGMQREAAERFLGQPRETLAAVLLKPWFEPAIVHYFRASDFAPRPGVEVVLLRLRRREAPLVTAEEADFFGDLVTYVYTAWQPTVREALTRLLPRRTVAAIEQDAEVRLDQPPRELPFSAWLRLTEAARAGGGEQIAAVRGARVRLERQQTGLQKVHRTRTTKRVAGCQVMGDG
jgi:23S rRNA (adenine-N6)-dimethyltransferase